MTVVASVAAVVAAYQDGGDLLKSIRERRRNTPVAFDQQEENKSVLDLEESLARGSDVIQSQYERDFRKLGVPFATGDEIAKHILEDILQTLRTEVIFNLSAACKQTTRMDEFLHVRDVSDSSQDRAVMCLMQLHQRVFVSAPLESMVSSTSARSAPNSFGSAPIDVRSVPAGMVGEMSPAASNRSSRSSRNKLSDIEPEPPSRLILQSYKEAFANNMAGPAPTNAPPERPSGHFSPNGTWSKHFDNIEPRIQPSSSMNSISIPMDYRGDEMYRQGRLEEEHSIYHEMPLRHDQRFDDSPTMAPGRISSPSTVSSRGSISPDDPEWNPWSAYKGSPLSSAPGSSPMEECRQSLVPEALNTTRFRESHATDPSRVSRNTSYSHNTDVSRYTDYSGGSNSSRNTAYSKNTEYSRHTDHSRNVSVDKYLASSLPGKPQGQYENFDDFYVEGKSIAAPWTFDDASVYSRESRNQSPVRGVQNDVGAYNTFLPQSSRHNSQYDPRPSVSTQGSVARQFSQASIHSNISPHDSRHYSSNPVSVFRQPSQQETRLHSSHGTPSMQDASSYESSLRSTNSLRKSPSLGWLSSRTQNTLSGRIPEPIQENRSQPPKVPDRSAHRPMPTIPYGSVTSGSIASTSGSTIILPPATPTSVTSGMSFQMSRMSVSTTSSGSAGSAPRPQPAMRVVAPAAIGNNKLCLPSEGNKYAGFCKGAWRAQIGDKKKTYEERVRPAALYSKNNTYYKCQKCSFEGRAIKPPGAKKTTPDTKVDGSNGILYRWEFLYKSHVHLKNALTSPLDSHFGCVFCCAAGKGTPIFAGVSSLLAHLQEHRDVLPEGEVLFRMNAIVGRSPDPAEDFDVALPAFVI